MGILEGMCQPHRAAGGHSERQKVPAAMPVGSFQASRPLLSLSTRPNSQRILGMVLLLRISPEPLATEAP